MQMATAIETDNGETIVKRVSVPIGLEELMEGLTKEVMLKKPKDMYVFASQYFAKLLELRNKAGIKGTAIPFRKAQSITKRIQPINTENIKNLATKKSKSLAPNAQLSRQVSVRSESPMKKVLTKATSLIAKEEKIDRSSDKTRAILDKRKTRTGSKDSSGSRTGNSSDGSEKKTPRELSNGRKQPKVVAKKTPATKGKITAVQQNIPATLGKAVPLLKREESLRESNREVAKVPETKNQKQVDIKDKTINTEEKKDVIETNHQQEEIDVIKPKEDLTDEKKTEETLIADGGQIQEANEQNAAITEIAKESTTEENKNINDKENTDTNIISENKQEDEQIEVKEQNEEKENSNEKINEKENATNISKKSSVDNKEDNLSNKEKTEEKELIGNDKKGEDTHTEHQTSDKEKHDKINDIENAETNISLKASVGNEEGTPLNKERTEDSFEEHEEFFKGEDEKLNSNEKLENTEQNIANTNADNLFDQQTTKLEKHGEHDTSEIINDDSIVVEALENTEIIGKLQENSVGCVLKAEGAEDLLQTNNTESKSIVSKIQEKANDMVDNVAKELQNIPEINSNTENLLTEEKDSSNKHSVVIENSSGSDSIQTIIKDDSQKEHASNLEKQESKSAELQTDHKEDKQEESNLENAEKLQVQILADEINKNNAVVGDKPESLKRTEDDSVKIHTDNKETKTKSADPETIDDHKVISPENKTEESNLKNAEILQVETSDEIKKNDLDVENKTKNDNILVKKLENPESLERTEDNIVKISPDSKETKEVVQETETKSAEPQIIDADKVIPTKEITENNSALENLENSDILVKTQENSESLERTKDENVTIHPDKKETKEVVLENETESKSADPQTIDANKVIPPKEPNENKSGVETKAKSDILVKTQEIPENLERTEDGNVKAHPNNKETKEVVQEIETKSSDTQTIAANKEISQEEKIENVEKVQSTEITDKIENDQENLKSTESDNIKILPDNKETIAELVETGNKSTNPKTIDDNSEVSPQMKQEETNLEKLQVHTTEIKPKTEFSEKNDEKPFDNKEISEEASLREDKNNQDTIVNKIDDNNMTNEQSTINPEMIGNLEQSNNNNNHVIQTENDNKQTLNKDPETTVKEEASNTDQTTIAELIDQTSVKNNNKLLTQDPQIPKEANTSKGTLMAAVAPTLHKPTQKTNKEQIKIKNNKTKSLSTDQLIKEERNLRRIKSVGTFNKDRKPNSEPTRKIKSQRTASGDVTKNRKSQSFDSSKLRQEIQNAEKISKFSNFKPTFNPHLLKQEIKNASKKDEPISKSNHMEDIAKKASAALKIQSIWRGYKSRKNNPVVKPNKKEELSNPKLIEAVIKLQALWRGFHIRKYKNRGELFGNTIESTAVDQERLNSGKRRKRQKSAAAKIQAVWRGYKVRRNMDQVNQRLVELQKPEMCDELEARPKEPTNEDLFKAATKIQAGVRGYMVRKKRDTSHLKSIEEDTDSQILEAIGNLPEVPQDSSVKSGFGEINNSNKLPDTNLMADSSRGETENKLMAPPSGVENAGKDADFTSPQVAIPVNKSESELISSSYEDAPTRPVTSDKIMKETNILEHKLDEQHKHDSVDNRIVGNNPLKSENKNVLLDEHMSSVDEEAVPRPCSMESATSTDSVDTVIFNEKNEDEPITGESPENGAIKEIEDKINTLEMHKVENENSTNNIKELPKEESESEDKKDTKIEDKELKNIINKVESTETVIEEKLKTDHQEEKEIADVKSEDILNENNTSLQEQENSSSALTVKKIEDDISNIMEEEKNFEKLIKKEKISEERIKSAEVNSEKVNEPTMAPNLLKAKLLEIPKLVKETTKDEVKEHSTEKPDEKDNKSVITSNANNEESKETDVTKQITSENKNEDERAENKDIVDSSNVDLINAKNTKNSEEVKTDKVSIDTPIIEQTELSSKTDYYECKDSEKIQPGETKLDKEIDDKSNSDQNDHKETESINNQEQPIKTKLEIDLLPRELEETSSSSEEASPKSKDEREDLQISSLREAATENNKDLAKPEDIEKVSRTLEVAQNNSDDREVLDGKLPNGELSLVGSTENLKQKDELSTAVNIEGIFKNEQKPVQNGKEDITKDIEKITTTLEDVQNNSDDSKLLESKVQKEELLQVRGTEKLKQEELSTIVSREEDLKDEQKQLQNEKEDITKDIENISTTLAAARNNSDDKKNLEERVHKEELSNVGSTEKLKEEEELSTPVSREEVFTDEEKLLDNKKENITKDRAKISTTLEDFQNNSDNKECLEEKVQKVKISKVGSIDKLKEKEELSTLASGKEVFKDEQKPLQNEKEDITNIANKTPAIQENNAIIKKDEASETSLTPSEDDVKDVPKNINEKVVEEIPTTINKFDIKDLRKEFKEVQTPMKEEVKENTISPNKNKEDITEGIAKVIIPEIKECETLKNRFDIAQLRKEFEEAQKLSNEEIIPIIDEKSIKEQANNQNLTSPDHLEIVANETDTKIDPHEKPKESSNNDTQNKTENENLSLKNLSSLSENNTNEHLQETINEVKQLETVQKEIDSKEGTKNDHHEETSESSNLDAPNKAENKESSSIKLSNSEQSNNTTPSEKLLPVEETNNKLDLVQEETKKPTESSSPKNITNTELNIKPFDKSILRKEIEEATALDKAPTKEETPASKATDIDAFFDKQINDTLTAMLGTEQSTLFNPSTPNNETKPPAEEVTEILDDSLSRVHIPTHKLSLITEEEPDSKIDSPQSSESEEVKTEPQPSINIENGEVEAVNLVHSGEFHDTIPIPISPPAPGLVHSAELHDHVLPLTVQLDEGPPAGAEVLTSAACKSISQQERAQASNKDASTCVPQPDSLPPPSPHSMEAEKRNDATNTDNMEAAAATKIQAGFRGYQVRKQLKNKVSGPGDISSQRRSCRRKSSGRLAESGRQTKLKSGSDLEEKSAVKIQAGVRGFLVRRRQQKKQKDGK